MKWGRDQANPLGQLLDNFPLSLCKTSSFSVHLLYHEMLKSDPCFCQEVGLKQLLTTYKDETCLRQFLASIVLLGYHLFLTNHMGQVPEITWHYLALPGIIWHYLAQPGIIWHYMEQISGVFWKKIFQYDTFSSTWKTNLSNWFLFHRNVAGWQL